MSDIIPSAYEIILFWHSFFEVGLNNEKYDNWPVACKELNPREMPRLSGDKTTE